MHAQGTRTPGFGPEVSDETLIKTVLAEDRMNIVPCQGEYEAVASTGPSAAELAEIEREWPLIAAELDLLDAEIAALSGEGRVSRLDRRRVRRAERRVLEVGRELAAEGVTAPAGQAVA